MIVITLIGSFFVSIILFLYCFVYYLISLVFDGDRAHAKRHLKIAFIFVMVFILSSFAFAPICAKLYTETIETARYELVSLQDSSEISGSARGNLFYLYASVNSTDVYTFYYTFQGGYKKGKISSENVIIYEEDNRTPCIIQYTTSQNLDMNPIIKGILTFGLLENSEVSYEVFVPKGTIIPAFSLDAQ